VLDFATRKVVSTIELPKDGNVEVIHHRLDSPSHGIGVAPDNKTLWVTSILANAVVAYSLPDLKPIGRVGLPQLRVPGRDPMASVPNWVTFTPDSKQIYISNGDRHGGNERDGRHSGRAGAQADRHAGRALI
jgi:DNA-binding beta-propeller fold protein YncE